MSFSAVYTIYIFLSEHRVVHLDYLLVTLFLDLQREGVFRVSGSSERQRELRERLDKGEKLDDLESKFTMNDYATVFKTFLAELPEPLLTERNFNAYVQIAGV